MSAAGCTGKDGASCSVSQNADGSVTVACDDGTSVTIPAPDDGQDGQDGKSCTVAANDDGTSTITCEDGTTAVVTDGHDGASCSVTDNGDGTKTIHCDDGTTVTVQNGSPGQPGGNVRITDLHGEDYLGSSGEYAAGKFLVNATITSATADENGKVIVNFKVSRTTNNAPVTNAAGISANIAKLVPISFTPPVTGQQSDQWVPYIYQTETVQGTGYPNPPGTQRTRGYRETNGQLVNHGDGTYTYTFATNLSNVMVGGQPVTYERNRTHRVSIMMGGHTGATADATFDFVPDGSAPVTTRDIVRTDTCKACHGGDFHGHGGDRLHVENCVTCHNPSGSDAQGGQTLDFMTMIHKIHMGGDLPSVAGPDGNPWATADNGTYAIWGYGNAKMEWSKVGFPAMVNNCAKCHDGSGADSTAWKTRPSIRACESCHDTLDITSPTTTHRGGPQMNDNNCSVCHQADVGLEPLSLVHDASTTNINAPLYDDRNVPEFTMDVTLTAPANGTDYRGNEAPVVRIVLKRNGVPLADHRIVSGAAQGCKHVASAILCDADTDGAFSSAGLFVAGPRAHAVPVLTNAARAQILSTGAGPFDLSAAGASLIVKLDQGVPITLADDWGTKVPGTITIPVSSGTWPNGTAAVTPAQLATWLNANTTFAQRAVAYVGTSAGENGKLVVRSRNLGKVFGVQLQASAVATAVFGGDLTVHMPSGSTASNQLTSTTDPHVTRFIDHIEYQLDPVTDLAPGTYVINLEIAQLGRVSATDYKTPSVKKVLFNVKQATEEKQVAGSCDSCHQTTLANGADGAILDPSRHYKILDATAVDQCHACHDYLPQAATDVTGAGGWTGARPISKRVHAVHFGSSLQYPLRTVDYANGDAVAGRNWDITFPQDVRNCQSCHKDGETSGSWATEASRLPCMGCHDTDAAMTHMKLNTDDPTPQDPWSGDEQESCKACH
ncbi:MAG TPA: OmcA/MtrC family decaheme c-type cytochrome [Kofleriaceae bacterium]|nr:OmcA/MtrC family decaheme c-type cytochrome [Kofleriaceae bacterium]